MGAAVPQLAIRKVIAVTWSPWLDEQVAKLYRSMPLKSHMDSFFHCIGTCELPISDVFSHVHSVNACHFANIAMLLGRKMIFDPREYRFVGDDEAEALKSRPQREPYRIEAQEKNFPGHGGESPVFVPGTARNNEGGNDFA